MNMMNYKLMSERDLESAVNEWYSYLDRHPIIRRKMWEPYLTKGKLVKKKDILLLFYPIFCFIAISFASLWIPTTGIMALLFCVAPTLSLISLLIFAARAFIYVQIVYAKEAIEKLENMKRLKDVSD